MSLELVRRFIGDITILDLKGRVTLGEGASKFRDAVRDLVISGRKKIILNYSNVTYQDSSGNGELVSSFTTVTIHGGSLVFLNLNSRLKDLMQITRFDRVIPAFDDEASAIRYLESRPLHSLCPICGARGWPPLLDVSSWPSQTCSDSNCGARFALAPDARNPALVERVQITTYLDEYIEVASGAHFRIIIAGRLNLFTSSGLSRLWRALPARIATFDLRLVTEITPEGRDALLHLIAQPNESEGGTISLEGLAHECARVFSSAPPVYPDDAAAVAALSDLVPKTPRWFARFQLTLP